MFGMFAADLFDAKVVNDEQEGDLSRAMLVQAGSVGDGEVSGLG
jgi:hypothetical protein